jgi:hypothetical protein
MTYETAENAMNRSIFEKGAKSMTGIKDPQVTRRGALDMQVCVPADWTEDKIKEFANTRNPCGTENGWFIREEGDLSLHLMLDA